MPFRSWAVGLREVQSGFGKGKVVFPYKIKLICFYEFIGVTQDLCLVYKKTIHTRPWRREKIIEKRREINDRLERSSFARGIHQG